MATITFDTLKFANQLKEAGVPGAQAEAEAKALSEILEVNLKDLATKDDLSRGLKELELRIDSRFEKVSGELTLIKWMLGIVLGGVIALILKSFFPA